VAAVEAYDLEREARAEERARELLRSCVNTEEWAMYETHGLIRVYGQANRSPTARARATPARYAYLIYPHKPIVAYSVESGRLLAEYCVAFGGERLPPSDDVLAKWLALTGDERGLIASANVHPIGRQIDPDRVLRDLARLACGAANEPVGGEPAEPAK
jgi:hypothetical protein